VKILSASVKVIDENNHIRIMTEKDVEITIKAAESPIAHIPEIQEAKPPKQKKFFGKKKSKKQ
jgi:hypothetical protein